MVFFRVKIIKGIPYLYLVKNIWDKKKKRSKQKVLKYYGKLKDIKKNDKLIFDRDQKCRVCGSTDRLVVDHILPLCTGGTNELENLWALCYKCNQKKRDLIFVEGKLTEVEKGVKLLANLKFLITAYEYEYRQKRKGDMIDTDKMRQAVIRRKKVKQIAQQLRDIGAIDRLKWDSYI